MTMSCLTLLIVKSKTPFKFALQLLLLLLQVSAAAERPRDARPHANCVVHKGGRSGR